MELNLNRDKKLSHATTGMLDIDGIFECYICEDVVRDPGAEKVPGKTAIGAGRFEIAITWSERFKRRLPLLMNVPNFTGIRIHSGNTELDTDGCLLPGKNREAEAGTVQLSVLAFNALFEKIDEALKREKVFITIH